MKITKMEAVVLNNIALNSYQPSNYSRPENFSETSSIWSRYILDSSAEEKVPSRSLPGICASLAKKDLVETTEDGKDSTICLTEAGYAAWEKKFPMSAKDKATVAQGKLVARYAEDKDPVGTSTSPESSAPEMPKCPTCNKNNRVFGSAMRGRKDFACTRCKKTFVKSSRRSVNR